MSNRPYPAAVIGLGRIGMGYDIGCFDDRQITTHSAAYFYHSGYELVGGVDLNSDQRSAFTQQYRAPAYSSIQILNRANTAAVYSLATPPSTHYDLFCQIVLLQPRAVLCEKPMTGSLNQAKAMRVLAKSNDILLFVNYMRRFEPGVESMMSLLKAKTLGTVRQVIVKYSNGFLNCASHFLDLLQQLFGCIEMIQCIDKQAEHTLDIHKNINVHCRIATIDIYLIGNQPRHYALYELEIIGDRGVLRYQKAGRFITYQTVVEASDVNRVELSSPVQCFNDYNRFQWYVMEAMYQSLSQANINESNADAAIEVLRVVNMLEKGVTK